jgi:hypothetical protein
VFVYNDIENKKSFYILVFIDLNVSMIISIVLIYIGRFDSGEPHRKGNLIFTTKQFLQLYPDIPCDINIHPIIEMCMTAKENNIVRI